MNILIAFLTVVHVMVAMFMIVLVLMQKSKDQGVGAAFGGGVTETVFGAGTTTALVRMTIWCACIFLAGSLILTALHSRRNAAGGRGSSLVERAIQTTPSSTVPGRPTPEAVPAMPMTPAPEAPATTPPTAPPAPAPTTTPATPPAPQPAAKPQP